MKISIKLIAISILFFIVSCGSVTKVTGFWNEKTELRQTYKKIGIIAVTSYIQNRQIVESKFAERFRINGYEAVECSKFLTPEIMKHKNKSEIANLLKKNNIDGFLIVSVLDIKESEHYVPGSQQYYPRTYYNNYYDYYYYQYDRVYTEGYYEKSVQVFLESNFYNVKSEKLISTIQTETANPADISDLADSFSNTIVKVLVENGVVKKVQSNTKSLK